MAACLGNDPDSDHGPKGGLGEPCFNGECLTDLACVEGVCRVRSESTGDAAPTDTDGSTPLPDVNAPDVDGHDADARARADADAGDGATGDGAPQCSEVTTTYRLCSAASTEATGVEWTSASEACSVGGASTSASLMTGSEASKDLTLTGFGHTIPSGATIESVSVHIVLSTSPGIGVQLDIRTFLDQVGDVAVKDLLAQTNGAPDTIVAELTSPKFTPAAVNSGLGVHIQAGHDVNDVTVAIDEVSTSVRYCE
jgi:hypothetical protein